MLRIVNFLLAAVVTHTRKGGRASNQCYERLTGSRVKMQKLQVAGSITVEILSAGIREVRYKAKCDGDI